MRMREYNTSKKAFKTKAIAFTHKVRKLSKALITRRSFIAGYEYGRFVLDDLRITLPSGPILRMKNNPINHEPSRAITPYYDMINYEYLNENKPRFSLKKAVATVFLPVALYVATIVAKPVNADTIIPLIEPSTTIELTNPTNKTLEGTVFFQQIQPGGSGTGTVPYSIPAGGSVDIPNQLTEDELTWNPYVLVKPAPNGTGSAQPEPVVTVQTCDNTNGYTPGTWGDSKRMNTSTLAGTLTTGTEYVIIQTGDAGATLKFSARGPDDIGGPMTGTIHVGISRLINVDGIFNACPPPGGSLEMEVVSGSAFAGLLYTDETTQSHSWRDLQSYSKAMMTPAEFVAANLPIDHFFLDNWEVGSLIRGDAGTRSYAYDMAKILYDHSTPQLPGDVAMLERILHYEVDGDYSNGEVCHTKDPLGCVNSSAAHAVILYESTENCSKVTNFIMDATGSNEFYNLMKTDALPSLVQANPDHYGYPDNSYTSWGTQDPN